MIKCGNKDLIEYKLHKLDKGTYFAVYEDGTMEVFAPNNNLEIKTNKYGKIFCSYRNKIYFLDKYL